jgi:hypothetical protein
MSEITTPPRGHDRPRDRAPDAEPSRDHGGSPGRRTGTERLAPGDPGAQLDRCVGDARGRIAAIVTDHVPGLEAAVRARDHGAARGAAFALRCALDAAARDLDAARRLARRAGDDAAAAEIDACEAELARVSGRAALALERAPRAAPTPAPSVDAICALGLATGFGADTGAEEDAAAWRTRIATGGDPCDGDVQATAQAGVARGGGRLPHLDAIQRSFGRHDVAGIEAHVGGAAADAADALGADAYATGHHVAFASEPDLFVAAHEAAHVVQQRTGVSLLGGVGAADDVHEQHADAVAARVVRGESAVGLLDEYRGGGVPAAAVQMDTKGRTKRGGASGGRSGKGAAAPAKERDVVGTVVGALDGAATTQQHRALVRTLLEAIDEAARHGDGTLVVARLRQLMRVSAAPGHRDADLETLRDAAATALGRAAHLAGRLKTTDADTARLLDEALGRVSADLAGAGWRWSAADGDEREPLGGGLSRAERVAICTGTLSVAERRARDVLTAEKSAPIKAAATAIEIDLRHVGRELALIGKAGAARQEVSTEIEALGKMLARLEEAGHRVRVGEAAELVRMRTAETELRAAVGRDPRTPWAAPVDGAKQIQDLDGEPDEVKRARFFQLNNIKDQVAGVFDWMKTGAENAVDRIKGEDKGRKSAFDHLVHLAAVGAFGGSVAVVANAVGRAISKGLTEKGVVDAIKWGIRDSIREGAKASAGVDDVLIDQYKEEQQAKAQESKLRFVNSFWNEAAEKLYRRPLAELRKIASTSLKEAISTEVRDEHARSTAIEWINYLARAHHGAGTWDPWAKHGNATEGVPTDNARPPVDQSAHAIRDAGVRSVDPADSRTADLVDNEQRTMQEDHHGILEIFVYWRYDGSFSRLTGSAGGARNGLRLDGVNQYTREQLQTVGTVGDARVNKIVRVYKEGTKAMKLNPPKSYFACLVTADGYARLMTTDYVVDTDDVLAAIRFADSLSLEYLS